MLFYQKCDVSYVKPSCPPSQLVPEKIYQAIWEDNTKFLIQKNLFDSDYTGFLLNLLNQTHAKLQDGTMLSLSAIDFSVSAPLSANILLQVIHIGTRFLFDVLCRSRDTSKLKSYSLALQNLFRCSSEVWFWTLISFT